MFCINNKLKNKLKQLNTSHVSARLFGSKIDILEYSFLLNKFASVSVRHFSTVVYYFFIVISTTTVYITIYIIATYRFCNTFLVYKQSKEKFVILQSIGIIATKSRETRSVI